MDVIAYNYIYSGRVMFNPAHFILPIRINAIPVHSILKIEINPAPLKVPGNVIENVRRISTTN